jgi:plasmid stability protein
MIGMKNLTIKSVPPELHERLRTRAVCNHRSLNKEVIAILSRAVDADVTQRPDAEGVLRRVDAVRGRMRPPGLDADAVTAAIEEGRP